MIIFFFKIWLCFEPKTPFFRRIFWQKYFKNHNIGPRFSQQSDKIVYFYALKPFPQQPEVNDTKIFWQEVSL
jgi:hypothetical protein